MSVNPFSTPRRLLLAALAAAVAACGQQQAAPKVAPAPPRIGVAAVRTAAVPVIREYVGTVAAYRSVEITARVEGFLEARHFTEGTDVRKGDLLYTIDPAQYQAKVRDAEAELARAAANLGNARAKAERLAPLAKEEAISQQDFDDAVAAQKAAEAQVESARANLETAKLNLGYTSVYANESGRIGETQVPEGRLVGRGTPTLLATIDKIDPIYVSFTTPDRDAIVLRKAFESGALRRDDLANTARFILPDGSELAVPGRVDFSAAQVNKDTGTITQRAVLPNPTRILLPGMYVRVELRVGERPNAVLVPQKAVVKMPNAHIAWVVGADNRIERRDLVVGEWAGDEWIIEKGLVAGERVVVDGVQRVQPGMAVDPVPVTTAAATGQGAAAAAKAAVPETAKAK